MKMRTLAIAIPLALAATTGSAQAQHHGGHVDYYVTVHNELSETVDFSCNRGTRRRVGVEGSRTVVIRGAHGMGEVTCVAYDIHDGSVLSSKHVHVPESRRVVVSFRASHDDH